VVADATQLRQILLNLVLNARDALGPVNIAGGKIRVSTRMAEWTPRDGKGLEPVHSGRRIPAQAELERGTLEDSALRAGTDDRRPLAVLLTVEDNGCGMSAETCGHLFEPFFTTKKAGEGTGIGLGTVRRIVVELGGTVEIASAPGSGTRVEVFLPVASRNPAQDFDTPVPNSNVEKK
jgi:two-component system cell cycle sensor histidine kinase/response regulator CckA